MSKNRRRLPWYKKVGYFLLEFVCDLLRIVWAAAMLALFVIVPCMVGSATDAIFGSYVKQVACGPGYYVGLLWVLGGITIAVVMVSLGWMGSCWERANEHED